MIKRVERKSITDEIIEQVLNLIASGSFMPGERIPGELELAQRFGVGRTSVREALKALEVLGLVTRSKEGTYVARDVQLDPVWQVLKIKFQRNVDLVQLFEARRVLESELAALAAERRTAQDLEQLESLSERIKRLHDEDFESYFRLDMEFHQQVASMAGNDALQGMWQIIFELLQVLRHDFASTPMVRAESEGNHRRLLDAIRDGNTTAARKAVYRMLDHVQGALLSREG